MYVTGIVLFLDKNECLANPCLNGATCNNIIGSYYCTCPPGFKGPLCGSSMYIVIFFLCACLISKNLYEETLRTYYLLQIHCTILFPLALGRFSFMFIYFYFLFHVILGTSHESENYNPLWYYVKSLGNGKITGDWE